MLSRTNFGPRDWNISRNIREILELGIDIFVIDILAYLAPKRHLCRTLGTNSLSFHPFWLQCDSRTPLVSLKNCFNVFSTASSPSAVALTAISPNPCAQSQQFRPLLPLTRVVHLVPVPARSLQDADFVSRTLRVPKPLRSHPYLLSAPNSPRSRVSSRFPARSSSLVVCYSFQRIPLTLQNE